MACKRCGRFGGLTTDGNTMVMKVCCEQGRISGGGGGGGGGGAAAAGTGGGSATGDNAAPVVYAPINAEASSATLSSSRHWFGSYVCRVSRAVAASAVLRDLRRMVVGCTASALLPQRCWVEPIELAYGALQWVSEEPQTMANYSNLLANGRCAGASSYCTGFALDFPPLVLAPQQITEDPPRRRRNQ